MHVLFVSNSEGRAQQRVRRVLDAYANRIAAQTWITPITEEALAEVRAALKRKISRHTSVACYRNVGMDRMELLWVVGNRHHYDNHGAFVAETAKRKRSMALPWRHAALLAACAGLAHDIGKANTHFQAKLRRSTQEAAQEPQSDPIRHEWVSAHILWRWLRGGQPGVLGAIETWNQDVQGARFDAQWMPFGDSIGDALSAVLLLAATHHHGLASPDLGLATDDGVLPPSKLIGPARHVRSTLTLQDRRALIIQAGHQQEWLAWQRRFERAWRRLQSCPAGSVYWHSITLVARACLILADQSISSSADRFGAKGEAERLYANTIRDKSGKRSLHQDLFGHLQAVAAQASRNVALFARPALPILDEVTAARLAQVEEEAAGPFAWQEQAVRAAREAQGPALVFNVAATGSGKTRANMRLACALRAGRHVRVALLFNLRTLTLQTHTALTEELGLDARTQCAALIGSREVLDLYASPILDDLDAADGNKPDRSGEAFAPLVCGGEGLREVVDALAPRLRADHSALTLLAAPVLCCTADFLNAAADMTEPNQRHAFALLRLLTSDLILDEFDSYDTKAIGAILRLVHTAAAFGRHVIVSSATLNDTLRRAITRAYRSGLQAYCASFGKDEAPPAARMLMVSHAAAARWAPLDDEQAFAEFCLQTASAAAASATLRRAFVQPIEPPSWPASLTRAIRPLHEATRYEIAPGKRFSWGLIRVANVSTCLEVSDFLAEQAGRQPAQRPLRLMTYHAREPLMRRTAKEEWLDRYLKRKGADWLQRLACLVQDELGQAWNEACEIVFVVVATPAEEVGRDHDFDWAIIEPSSMHSIIQTAGRVNRHRHSALKDGVCNIAVLDQNRRASEGKVLAFVRPGFELKIDEGNKTTHRSHRVGDLLPQGRIDIDQRLLFGNSKVAFQIDDEAAQEKELAHLHDKLNPGSVLWWSDWTAKRYPLREGDHEVEYSITLNANDTCNLWLRGKRIESNVVIAAAPPCALGEHVFGYEQVWRKAQRDGRITAPFWAFSVPQASLPDTIKIGWSGVEVKESNPC
ncbi:CRISPR-associated nuclease/helicase Cas3 subtype I-F/YPEST [Tepidimonas alkaliphilus]|uniref:CRISPR-associated nuclease/helicase Cas3 subtype I-F/YPEST n=1 Tax=Tepidimonas alkaliphilus TaxID=2588942 RepID=A0A554W3U7_9BURK|nr:CRISPR-associated endonuclease Cas3'' [Tepidimonas alkaliphilus]TSE18258.1 CRISPR-associated nuclease/helicase Cas3 subtype I-F/YPEST [Tepidimonas alkaliphilus]